MMTEVSIQTERVDDLPLLVWQQQAMGIPQIIDEIIQPHGNRQGLSVGWMVVGWLSYILSQADHRLSYVESWAAEHLTILQALLPVEVTVRDFTDDRLGDVLNYLSQDAAWSAIESKLGQQIIQVYALPQQRAYVDSTSAAVYHNPDGQTLLQYGLSKDHRPDLTQFKIMLSSLAPLGLPLATLVVPGNKADDGLYLPVIEQSRKVLQRHGVLYIGDSKMEALSTRASLAAAGDYYLTPLSLKGKQAQLLYDLLEPVWTAEQTLMDILAPDPEDQEPRVLAQAFEIVRQQEAMLNDELSTWQERVLVVYSPILAKQASQGLSQRLQRAKDKLMGLTPPVGRGRRQWSELAPLQMAAEAIVKRHRTEGLLTISYERQESQRHIRKYKDRPARTETTVRYQIQVTPEASAIEQAQRTLGWRLYVTNCSVDQLPLDEAILAYRQGPIFERSFSRLKNRPLGLRPLYVHRKEHIVGLVRLLSLALRLLTLVEFIVRRQLQTKEETLAGLYEGNSSRTTDRPTTERLLRAFKPITLTRVRMSGQTIVHVTPLTELQSCVLALLGLPDSLYSNLPNASHAIPP